MKEQNQIYQYQFSIHDTDDEMVDWCWDRFGEPGKPLRNTNHIWTWFFSAEREIIFMFKNEADYTEFVLSIG